MQHWCEVIARVCVQNKPEFKIRLVLHWNVVKKFLTGESIVTRS